MTAESCGSVVTVTAVGRFTLVETVVGADYHTRELFSCDVCGSLTFFDGDACSVCAHLAYLENRLVARVEALAGRVLGIRSALPHRFR